MMKEDVHQTTSRGIEQAGRAISEGPHDLTLTVKNCGRIEAMFPLEDDKRLATLLGHDVSKVTASWGELMYEPNRMRTSDNEFSRPSRNINEAFKLVKLLEDEYDLEIDVRPYVDGCHAKVQSWPTRELAAARSKNMDSSYLAGHPPSQVIPMAIALCIRALLDNGLMEAKKVVDERRRKAAGL